jgi:hypothetical protein
MKAGIDYGLGQVNVDHETGIRYGVIPANELGQAWYDSCEAYYGEPTCPECGSPVVEWQEKHEGYKGWGESLGSRFKWLCCADYACESCHLTFWDDSVWPDTPLSWHYEDEEYSMEQSGDDPDVFIIRSPYYTYCAFCSPCAPGAGYVLSQLSPDDGIRAYCPGPDWWEDEPPIAIYSVTGERVQCH